MTEARIDRMQAAQLPQGDVIGILLSQHARIRELFARVDSATGQGRQEAFDELRQLLAVHEVAEEMIVRPVTRDQSGGGKIAELRNEEESKATHVLAELEGMEAQSAEFTTTLATFKADVLAHAEREEREEFPLILSGKDEEERRTMGKAVELAEKTAPTHPHPSAAGSTAAQYVAGPFASLLDHARDAVHKVMSGRS